MLPMFRAIQGLKRAPGRRRRCLQGLAALLLAAGGMVVAETLSEGSAKAAFVFNFAKFTEWPSEAFGNGNATVALCLLRGVDSYEVNLGAFSGKSVQGKPFSIRPMTRPEALRQCQMVFLDELDERRMTEVLRGSHGLAVLTVSDIEGFAEAGGMIGLVHVDNRIQFEVNPEAIQASGLKMSAQLLQLAKIVKSARGKS